MDVVQLVEPMRSFTSVREAQMRSVVDELPLSLLRNFHVLLVCENNRKHNRAREMFFATFAIFVSVSRVFLVSTTRPSSFPRDYPIT